MELKYDNLIVASQGSQGIHLIRKLFEFGISISNLNIITEENVSSNKPFIDFLEYYRINYFIITNKNDLDIYFSQIDKRSLLISFSFRYIFQKSHLEIINYMAINFHPGRLPYYKGSFSTSWSLINGESKVGYAYHMIHEKVDSGDIVFEEEISISKYDNAFTLNHKIFNSAINHLQKVFFNLEKGDFKKQKIDIGKFYYSKLPFDGIIQQNWELEKIERFIKAMYFPPLKGAIYIKNDLQYEIFSIEQYLELLN